MKVFVTGASGFVGTAVVSELIEHGHQVIGLVRSEEAAKALAKTGAEVHRGNIEDLPSLRKGAELADGVIHTAFNHDFSKFAQNCENDRLAIGAIAEVLAGSARPFVVTSGTALVQTRGRLATEEDRGVSGQNPRIASELAVDAATAKGVRAMALRLSPSTHGEGDHGFVPLLIGLSKEKGVAGYLGEGLNRWPGVHRLDAAKLYRLAVEKGRAGARYHAAAEEGVTFKDIASVISRRLGIPLKSLTGPEADAHFTWFKHFAAIDNPTSSQKTREELGWKPTEIDLLADIDQAYYFQK